jgi:mono/diheme cytochrome c family protein
MTHPQHFFSQTLGGFAVATALCVAPTLLAAADAGFSADQITFFESRIRPVLAERCQGCHGATKHENGLRLDSRDAVVKGSDYGKAVEPGNPSASKLIRALKAQPGVEKMPRKGDLLTAAQIADFEKWITEGLPWPTEAAPAAVAHVRADPTQHWAFQPVKKPAVPVVKGQIQNPIDAFIRSNLAATGLDFAPPASPAVLCRRLFLTITGLQPTFEDVQAFEKAAKDGVAPAVDALVTDLLSRPSYGERWGRYWLDIARYSDTEGYTAGGRDNRFPHAYTYRNWVVQSLNDDMPYDKFVMCQLAADRMLPEAELVQVSTGQPAMTKPNKDLRDLAALGFLTVNDRFLGDRVLQNDDRIDVIGRGLLGLTVGCARCHDHKYDPIPSKDYYALYSVLSSCDLANEDNLPIIDQPRNEAAVAEFRQAVAKVDEQRGAFRKEVFDDIRQPDRLREYLLFANNHRSAEDGAFRGAAGKASLRDRVADKWRDFLNRFAFGDQPHPAMLIWRELADVPADQFAGKAKAALEKLTAPQGPLNREVAAAFKAKPTPKNFDDVVRIYAEVFLSHLTAAPPGDAQKDSLCKLVQSGLSPMSVPVEGVENFFTRKDRERTTKFDNEVKQLEISSPGAPLRAMAVFDRAKPVDGRIMIRGNPARPGEVAPRAYLTFFGGQKFTQGSGRLELAKLIASRDNPLTARVIVNRVWMMHFGKPLVSQPSDFGVQTPKPAQLALLDWLAATFMEEGWSLKKLHRQILTSQAYQQSCEVSPEKAEKDADNDLICRQNRQRLDYEAMRDNLLKVSGTLNAAQSAGRAIPLDAGDADTWRSVYLLVDRYEQPTVPATFDFANPDSHSPQRFVTTVPQQALFLMNSPFMVQRASQLVEKLPVQGSSPDAETIRALYRRVLLRNPTMAEQGMAQQFLGDAESLQRSEPFLWKYGTTKMGRDAKGQLTLSDWQPFKDLNRTNKRNAWSHTGKIPDPVWHYAFWSPSGGHAGADDVGVTLRWTAPYDATIRIEGKLNRPAERGNGVRAWIVSDRQGVIKDVAVGGKQILPVAVAALTVKAGEELSFVVGSEGETDSDSFIWAPQIFEGNTLLTDAAKDLCGKNGWPIDNRPHAQTPLSQLTQVLIMSNEFMFVD